MCIQLVQLHLLFLNSYDKSMKWTVKPGNRLATAVQLQGVWQITMVCLSWGKGDTRNL